MKKVLMIVAIIIAMLIGFYKGANTVSNNIQNKYKNTESIEFIGFCDKNKTIREWRDIETGIHYISIIGSNDISPRYFNSEGHLYVD